jgi:thiol-disulfide isomerase/thioredoxin
MKTFRSLFALIVSFAVTALTFAEPVDPIPAPAWTLKDVNGQPVSSDQFKGKVVVVDFWATWCGPCRAEIPGYVSLQKKYGPEGLVIVGISLDAQGPGVVKKFMQQHGMNYQVVMGDDEVQAAFGGAEGLTAIPTTFIIDRSGKIRDRKVGAEHTADFEARLVQYLK